MAHFIGLFLSLLLLAGSCGPPPIMNKGPWSLKLTTSGGFAGIGTGNLSLDSDGNTVYEAPVPPSQVKKGCQGKMYKEKFDPINDAVARANPRVWNLPELNVAAPDAFGYKLELKMGDETTNVQWYDNTRDKLPDDLKRLSDALLQQMKAGCSFGNPKSGPQ